MTTTLTAFDSYKLVTQFSEDGASFVHTIPGAIPGAQTRVETWTRVERIGKGTFGSVYKEQCDNGAIRAVKVILNSSMNIRELLALTRMTSYADNFVQLSGWFQDDTNIYLAMEYFPCGDLHALIQESDGGLSRVQMKTVTIQLLEGLKIMHSLSFCHRDLKPQNVLIVTWFPLVVKIADFGTTKEAGDETALRTIIGTPDYLAPEVLGIMDSNTSEYTDAVDMWSLGCLIFAMATKKTPFPGTKGLEAFLKGSRFPGEGLLEPELREFLMTLMRPFPYERLTAEQALGNVWLGTDVDTWGAQINLRDVSEPIKMVVNPAEPHTETKLDNNSGTWEREHEVEDAEILVRPSVDNGLVVSGTDARRPHMQPYMKMIGVALNEAAGHGHTEIVQRMLDAGADLTFRDRNGNTALHRAVQRGHTDVVHLLLQSGADTMAKGFGEATPLIMAAALGRKELVQLLLDEGTDITATDSEGHTVLHSAALNGYPDIVRFLLEHEEMNIATCTRPGAATPLQLAARGGWKDVIEMLLEKGASITGRGPDGYTALHSAASRGRLEAVKLLLDRGAEIGLRTDKNSTALTLAATDGHEKVVKLLLDRGADIAERGYNGYTSLHLAAEEGHYDVVLLLLQRGADIAATEDKERTALHLAAAEGFLEIVQLLIDWDKGTARRDIGLAKAQKLPINNALSEEDDSLLLETGSRAVNTSAETLGSVEVIGLEREAPERGKFTEHSAKTRKPTLAVEEDEPLEGEQLRKESRMDASQIERPTLPEEERAAGVELVRDESGVVTSQIRRPALKEGGRGTVGEGRLLLDGEEHPRPRVKRAKVKGTVSGENIPGRRGEGKQRISGWRSKLDDKIRCVIS